MRNDVNDHSDGRKGLSREKAKIEAFNLIKNGR